MRESRINRNIHILIICFLYRNYSHRPNINSKTKKIVISSSSVDLKSKILENTRSKFLVYPAQGSSMWMVHIFTKLLLSMKRFL